MTARHRIFGKRGFSYLFVLCVGSPVAAETLSGALGRAYLENAELREQRAAVRVRDEDVAKEASGWRPRVTVSANGGPERAKARESSGTGFFSLLPEYKNVKKNGYSSSKSLSVTQSIFDGWKTESSLRVAETNVLEARAKLRQAEQETLLSAVTAYMNVLRDSATLALRAENIKVLQEQSRVTADRFDAGEVTITDIAQAEASLAQANSDYAAAQGSLENSLSEYQRFISPPPRRLEPARPLLALLPKNREEAIQIAWKEHPIMEAAMQAILAGESGVAVAKSALMPTVSVAAQLTQQTGSYLGDPNTRQFSAQFLGQLNAPLYQGGAEYAGVRQAKEQLGQARIHADVQRLATRAGVVQAYTQLTTATAAITFGKRAVKAGEVALRGVRDEAAFGQRTTLDVLNAQQTLLDARVKLVTAQRDEVVGSYAVLAAIGRLSAARLALKAPGYDPVDHYEAIKGNWFGLSAPEAE